ncbi:interleukin-like EMT inducer domain-containing protein [Coleofasciculus sp.]|uniref:interleukin-like EMT inducer domain-containing protein n=1 Tax=Coleofasciculus sp. TaxID=3100458 RepID=UPI0039FB0C49
MNHNEAHLHITVQSAAYDQGNSARITVNDEEFGFEPYNRGLNVAVIHEVTGQKLGGATFDTFGDPSCAIAFAEWVENLPVGRIVAIALKDEGTVYLDERAKNACAALGAYWVYYLQFRSSWAMIGQKGATPGTAVEALSDEHGVTCSRSFTLPSIFTDTATISATSAGGEYGFLAHISRNGNIIPIQAGYQRGLNLVVFEPATGKPVLSRSFDLFADASVADAFAQQIEGIPDGKIVAIALKDDAFVNLSERAKQACRAIGSRLIDGLQFRGAWSIVGYKGASPDAVIENLNNSGFTSVKAWMPLVIPCPTWQPKQKLQPADLREKGIFGSAIAMSGDTAIIGARLAQVDGCPAVGSAYIFQHTNGVWIQKQKLQPPGFGRQDVFGNAVAIHGNFAIVGAYFADAPDRPNAGCAYIFQQENGVWRETQKLQPADLQGNDCFGSAVAISDNMAIIGAYTVDAESRPDAGSTYIFQLENGVWQQQQKLQPDELKRGDGFGGAVAISGETAIIGARLAQADSHQYAGSAYIFQLENGVWQQKQKLQPTDLQYGDNFGNAIAISGEVAIVGAYGVDAQSCPDTGAAYIFQRENGVWQQKQKLQPADLQRRDGFGCSVAIQGQVAVVGTSDAGSVYIFQLENGVWQQKQKLYSPEAQPKDCFGYAVALSEGVVITGAHNADAQGRPYAGSAYIACP